MKLVDTLHYFNLDKHLDINLVVLVVTLLVREQLWRKTKVITMLSGESLMTLMNMYSEEKVLTSLLLEDQTLHIQQHF